MQFNKRMQISNIRKRYKFSREKNSLNSQQPILMILTIFFLKRRKMQSQLLNIQIKILAFSKQTDLKMIIKKMFKKKVFDTKVNLFSPIQRTKPLQVKDFIFNLIVKNKNYNLIIGKYSAFSFYSISLRIFKVTLNILVFLVVFQIIRFIVYIISQLMGYCFGFFQIQIMIHMEFQNHSSYQIQIIGIQMENQKFLQDQLEFLHSFSQYILLSKNLLILLNFKKQLNKLQMISLYVIKLNWRIKKYLHQEELSQILMNLLNKLKKVLLIVLKQCL
ncbi:unnamed protein product [Paramecium sonneborni]|uniref:Transmembrane protein n=1 Tax=Paramecium sonneborni TaxID=65129 RepID=A0A8S1LIM6_9CILI|nr:unnamed protein product [Paramecium sonneborni]